VRTKTIRIDNGAHKILLQVKEDMKRKGIENPTHSDAIRYLRRLSEGWK